MFKRSFGMKERNGNKPAKITKRSFGRDGSQGGVKRKLLESMEVTAPATRTPLSPTAPIVTIAVGPGTRLFAAHEEILNKSPVFAQRCREAYFTTGALGKRLSLPHEDPETFSHVLEYLYKDDYTPALLKGKTGTYYVDGATADVANAAPYSSTTSMKHQKNELADRATLFHTVTGATILRDTAVYCAAQAYQLPALQKLALRKQGLQVGIDVGTILRSMRFAYTHTPDSDSRLRAHFLALIVRARKTFKRSGTMQAEMSKGGPMFFDLFVALCNHLDDVEAASTTPKTV
ncbi:MAG: hypothetical protein Q9162_003539 [Coniocarpon cinnabarinum]